MAQQREGVERLCVVELLFGPHSQVLQSSFVLAGPISRLVMDQTKSSYRVTRESPQRPTRVEADKGMASNKWVVAITGVTGRVAYHECVLRQDGAGTQRHLPGALSER